MLLRLDVAAPLVHVELDIHIALVLHGEQVVFRIDDRHAALIFDVASHDRAGFRHFDHENRLLEIVGE